MGIAMMVAPGKILGGPIRGDQDLSLRDLLGVPVGILVGPQAVLEGSWGALCGEPKRSSGRSFRQVGWP